MAFDPHSTLENARRLRPEFSRLVADLPAEPRGILFSEMLFLKAALGEHAPRQVLESGRARGQSTVLLARLFPRSLIVSVEHDADSEDARYALERLRDVPNAAPLFGDSRRILPELVLPGDIVLIDGPKGFRALRLAFRLLAGGRPVAVFVHDLDRSTEERRFLRDRLPEVFYSDEKAFVEEFSSLDEGLWRSLEAQGAPGWRPYAYDGAERESYGPTLACIPHQPGRPYARLLRSVILRELFAKVGRRVNRRR